MIKQFAKWIILKEQLHERTHKPPFVSEGDMWWISFGENVGSEINGKSEKFTRPAIILKKLAHGFYLVAPTTTKSQEGTWYVHVRHLGVDEYACLHQIRTVDCRRLYSKIGQLDDTDFMRIKKGFLRLYG